MKMTQKMFLIVLLLALLATFGFGFEKGSKMIDGRFAMSVSDPGPGPYLRTSYLLSFSPSVGYFITDNLVLDLAPEYYIGWGGFEDRTGQSVSLGLGARYFLNSTYGGFKFDYLHGWGEGYTRNSKFLTLRLGQLFGLAKNIYLDLGLNYMLGLGKEKSGDRQRDNDAKYFRTSMGLVILLK